MGLGVGVGGKSFIRLFAWMIHCSISVLESIHSCTHPATKSILVDCMKCTTLKRT